VATRNRAKSLKNTLSSLDLQLFPKNRFEIIVIDNDSIDDTKNEIKKLSKISTVKTQYIFEKRLGISYARNAGLNCATGDWIIYFDDDALVDTHFLSNLDHALKTNPAAKAFGGKALLKYPDKLPFFWSKHFEGYLSAIDYGNNILRLHFPKTPYGLNMGFDRTTLKMLKGFNESIIFGGDETELFYRIEREKIPVIYIPECFVYHSVSEKRFTFTWLFGAAYRSGKYHAKLELIIKERETIKKMIFNGLKKIITGKRGFIPISFSLYTIRIIGYIKFKLCMLLTK
jgi:glycosyltransferase involved in cell wall biosynthesis